MLGVVQPGAVQAVAATRNGRVGYMATQATVSSGAYEKAIAAADPFVTVAGVACPGLVPLIERGAPFDAEMVDAVRHYTRPLREAQVDTVILGCTHYPLIRPLLQRMLGRGVQIVSSGDAIARQVEHVLGSRGLGNPSRRGGRLPLPDAPATPRRCARPARASCSCRSARSSTSRCRRSSCDHGARALRRPRGRRAAAGDDRARVRAHGHRLGADHAAAGRG